VSRHEDTSAALLVRALATKPVDLSVLINLVVLENSQLDFLVLMLVLLGSSVVLLLALLGTTTKAQHQVQRRLLLDVVVRQSTAIFQLLASEDQTLLIRRDSFLVLDLGLDILDGVRGFDLESDGLAREGLHEDLHIANGRFAQQLLLEHQ